MTNSITYWEQKSAELIANSKHIDALNIYAANCPPEFAQFDIEHSDLSNFRPQIDYILNWPNISKIGILATGPTGRGKTRTIWELIRRLATQGIAVRYFHAADFFATLANQTAYGRDEALSWIHAVASRPLIFIDDWGQEAVKKIQEQQARQWFFRFLDLRSSHGLPLFLTTNLTGAELAGESRELRQHPLIRRVLSVAQPVPFETPEELQKRKAKPFNPQQYEH